MGVPWADWVFLFSGSKPEKTIISAQVVENEDKGLKREVGVTDVRNPRTCQRFPGREYSYYAVSPQEVGCGVVIGNVPCLPC